MARLFCKNCNGYYELQLGESPDDFECCSECNGILEYIKDNVDDPYGWDLSIRDKDLEEQKTFSQ